MTGAEFCCKYIPFLMKLKPEFLSILYIALKYDMEYEEFVEMLSYGYHHAGFIYK